MVLQRDCKVRVWGWADPGEKLVINFHGQTDSAIAGADGKWTVIFLPMKAGGPFNMEIRADNRITLKNILIGDVWVCSGQSNMVLPMERVKEHYPDIIARAANPDIRQFFIPTSYDFNGPREDLPPGHWESADPKTVLQFTATGYFFAKALFARYHVPIGLINASVGGTPVAAWLSEDALKPFPAYLQILGKFRDSGYTDSILNADQTINSNWNDRIQKGDLGLNGEKPWYDSSYNATGWKEMNLPGYWDDQGLKQINGVVWFKKEIIVPASMTGIPAKLFLGRIVDRDYTYVNSVLAGTTGYQYPPRRYELPPGLLKPGRNSIVIRVINNSGSGGFVVDKPYRITAGRQTIDLRGKWKFQLGIAMPPLPPSVFIQYQPVGLFNGMISPLLKCSVTGVIWYQGESNTSRPSDYRELFSSLIGDWRKKWGQGNIPFLFVQLPNYGKPSEQPSESGWALLREAQLETLDLPNTGMAVTIDIGEWNDLHPLDKKDVGDRLALAARKIAYGDRHLVYSGPLYRSMKIERNKIILNFNHTGSGLMAKGGVLRQFAIAGSNNKFVWASAEIAGDRVVVWSPGVTHPVSVRYAWADNPEGANLYNREGLPASPFRTNK